MKHLLLISAIALSPLLATGQIDSFEIFNGPHPDQSKLYLYGAVGINSSITRSTDPRRVFPDVLSWEETSAKLGFEIKTRNNWYYHLCYEYRSFSSMGRANADFAGGILTWYNSNGIGFYVGKPIFFRARELVIVNVNMNATGFTYNHFDQLWWREEINFQPAQVVLEKEKHRTHASFLGVTFKRDFKIYHGFYLSLQYSFNQGLYNYLRSDYQIIRTGEKFKMYSRGTHYEALLGVRLKMFNLSR